jgi:hypothetical protein
MCKGEAVALKVLMRTPHHSCWGTSILQPWCSGFNLRKPKKMKMLMRVILKDVPMEYKSSTMDIIESMEPILGKNKGNTHHNE